MGGYYALNRMEKVSQKRIDIGWRLFLYRHLTHKWSKVQQTYLEWSGSRQSGNTWVSTLIMKLCDLEWKAWEDRNTILHNTPFAVILSEALLLDQFLPIEWTLDLNSLPVVVGTILPDDISVHRHYLH